MTTNLGLNALIDRLMDCGLDLQCRCHPVCFLIQVVRDHHANMCILCEVEGRSGVDVITGPILYLNKDFLKACIYAFFMQLITVE